MEGGSYDPRKDGYEHSAAGVLRTHSVSTKAVNVKKVELKRKKSKIGVNTRAPKSAHRTEMTGPRPMMLLTCETASNSRRMPIFSLVAPVLEHRLTGKAQDHHVSLPASRYSTSRI